MLQHPISVGRSPDVVTITITKALANMKIVTTYPQIEAILSETSLLHITTSVNVAVAIFLDMTSSEKQIERYDDSFILCLHQWFAHPKDPSFHRVEDDVAKDDDNLRYVAGFVFRSLFRLVFPFTSSNA